MQHCVFFCLYCCRNMNRQTIEWKTKRYHFLLFLWGGYTLWSVKLFEVIKFLSGCAQERWCSIRHTWENSTFIQKTLSQQFELINIHSMDEINSSTEDKHLSSQLPVSSVVEIFNYSMYAKSSQAYMLYISCARSVRCCTYKIIYAVEK